MHDGTALYGFGLCGGNVSGSRTNRFLLREFYQKLLAGTSKQVDWCTCQILWMSLQDDVIDDERNARATGFGSRHICDMLDMSGAPVVW